MCGWQQQQQQHFITRLEILYNKLKKIIFKS